jgi:hypothetical protein
MKLLYIGVPWPHGLQKRFNPFIAALKSHEITLHWYGGRPYLRRSRGISDIYKMRTTARHAKHLQFDISAKALEIRAAQSPKCVF